MTICLWMNRRDSRQESVFGWKDVGRLYADQEELMTCPDVSSDPAVTQSGGHGVPAAQPAVGCRIVMGLRWV